VIDLIDQIEEVRARLGDLIQALAQRCRELQAEEDQEEIDLATAEEVDMDITPFAEARESLRNASPVVAPQARLRQYNSDLLELPLADGLLIAMMNIRGGVIVWSRQIGVAESTLRSRRDQINRDPNWRPWIIRSMHADRRTWISREELSLLRQKLRENPQREEGIMTAMDFLSVLRSWWEEAHPEQRGPDVTSELPSASGMAWGYHGGEHAGRRGRQRTRRGKPRFGKISGSYCGQCQGRG
jgi:hypothetical protein